MASNAVRGALSGEAYFAPDSMVRRVHREGVILLGGGRALLLQIAHPAVAAGVAEHSSFQTRRTDRLLRTLRSTLAIVFGSREQALTAASRINTIHRSVTSEEYDARDPELLLWVLSTLIDTSLIIHERFVRKLRQAEAQAYYQDMRRIGALLGIPQERLPERLEEHQDYFATMIASLQVSSAAKALAAELFRPSPGLAPVMWLVKQLSAGLLPPRLRREFDLSWGPKREATLTLASGVSRLLIPRIPAAMRAPPGFLLPAKVR